MRVVGVLSTISVNWCHYVIKNQSGTVFHAENAMCFSFWGTFSPRYPTGALPLDPTGGPKLAITCLRPNATRALNHRVLAAAKVMTHQRFSPQYPEQLAHSIYLGLLNRCEITQDVPFGDRQLGC